MTQAELMKGSVDQLLVGIERYNPEHLSTLEKYVEVQCAENVYDLEANLAVLKLYQFHQNYNMKITSQILLKALTNFPHTDFILCKCLLSKDLCKEDPIDQIIYLADLLESCKFTQFWSRMHTIPDLFLNIEGFNDSIRKFVCHVVGITFQTIDKKLLSELLDGVEDSTLRLWVKKYGWKELDNGYIFIANQDENIKTKNITEKIEFENAATIMTSNV
ncbi:eukaryotic translation initiation factor 3 subunit K [Diaphorina citri]|uniref:Eukaryotic translation initiation factor 3 subunit K n=1 Tax=Diaphorina citri TaxID=121845 RepID=A0A1S3CTS2_DIACI|nr:eukaryotic translation initiation factor 3 subunit K [Diaphorina citri]KAI5710205.1 hypothetical protein M8J75_006668 [Diaphorina citri]